MNLVEQAACCRVWQDRLGLKDWTIQLEPANVYKLGENRRTATIEYEECFKTAKVSILPVDSPEVQQLVYPYDAEEAIVHELLHLHFAGLPRPENDAQILLQEQALNMIARALVLLARTQDTT